MVKEKREILLVPKYSLVGGREEEGFELRVEVLYTVNPIEWYGQGPGAPLSAPNARKLGI